MHRTLTRAVLVTVVGVSTTLAAYAAARPGGGGRVTCKYVVIEDNGCADYNVGDIYCLCGQGGCPSGGATGFAVNCGGGGSIWVNDAPEAGNCKYGDPCAGLP